MLVNHPNTPPFIGKQLIQKTVTSSPTPGYVARVAAVFKDNGNGVRGDLAAVTRAILLDPEARGARKIDRGVRPPARAGAVLDRDAARARRHDRRTVMPYDARRQSGQSLFDSPTVFNYYPADYTLAGGSIPAPGVRDLLVGGVPEPREPGQRPALQRRPSWSRTVYGWGRARTSRTRSARRSPTLSAFLPDAANPDALVERLNRLVPARDDDVPRCARRSSMR